MKIAVWRTAHDIANTIARYGWDSFCDKGIEAYMVHTGAVTPEHPEYQPMFLDKCDVHIAYGILRGTADIFRKCDRLNKPWFNIDRGYFKPSHYDGYYRVSLRGTQQTSGWPEPDYERLDRLKLDIKPWRGFDHNKPALICPPTDHVRQFFGYTGMAFKDSNTIGNYVIRTKGNSAPINFHDYNYVLTFNSSVGWQALQAGIPCVSNAQHSIVGAWFKNYMLCDELSEIQSLERHKLFAVMSALQLTLKEMEQGLLWPLMERLLVGSGGIVGSRSAATLPSTVSSSALIQA